MEKRNDNSIVLGINKKNKAGLLNWYIVDTIGTSEAWRASEKITNNKAIMYTIYHNSDNPESSYMTIHLEKRYMSKSNTISSDLKLIMTLRKLTHVLMLLKKAIEQSGSKIIGYSTIIIEKNDDRNLILLTKDKQFDRNWILPGNVLNSLNKSNKVELVKTELKNYGIFLPDVDTIRYRNIMKFDNIYYYIIPYVVKNYECDKITKKHIWIDKRDIQNYHIGPESKRVITFYRKDGLPF